MHNARVRRALRNIAAGHALAGAVPLILAAVLVFVWPLPNMIAMRIALLLGLLVSLATEVVRRPETRNFPRQARLASWILAALAAWFCVVALCISEDTRVSLGELKAGWLRTFVAFAAGLMLPPVLKSRQVGARPLFRILFWILLSLAAIQLAIGLWDLLTAGALPDFFGGLFDHKANITYVNAIAASLLLADSVKPARAERLLGLGRAAWIASFALLVVTTYMSGTRAGILVLLLLVLFAGIVHLRAGWHAYRWKVGLPVLALAAFLLAGSWAMIKSDARWARFAATVPVAWDIDKSHSWLDIFAYPMPPGTDGKPVDPTTYERISWARYAMRLVAEHPLGTDLTRNAYRNLVAANLGPTRAAHSHNGYLDFALAAGLPALALWCAFLATLAWPGLKRPSSVRDGAALALLLLTAAFAVRALFDSILRDHILEEFAFFAALLLAASGLHDESGAPRNG
jgi:hypothetical protein